MNIGISGGSGLEEILFNFKEFQITLVGSSFDISTEKFKFYENVTFYPEFLTHNYIEEFARSCDIYIDISPSNKIKYLVSDFASYFDKICYLLFYDSGWKIIKLSGKDSHLSFYKKYSPSLPYFLLPEVDRKVLNDFFLEEKINFLKRENFIFDLSLREKKSLILTKEDLTYDFLKGQFADVASVSCSDNSVAISQMNMREVNLNFYKEHLSKYFKLLKETPFFIEFKYERFRVLFFKQGRFIIKGTKEKNTAFYVFYNFFGV